MLKSICILLAIVAYFDYEIWQMDVKTTFLNGNIEEALYMVQPEGFVDPKDANKVCKLQRSIYGLKQASRSWNLCFDEVFKGFGFVQNTEESCIYKKMGGSSFSFPVLYVDNILLIRNCNIPNFQYRISAVHHVIIQNFSILKNDLFCFQLKTPNISFKFLLEPIG
jgi:hypothetical protein